MFRSLSRATRNAGEWVILAQADSPEALKLVIPSLAELPAGTQGRTEVMGTGLGLLADAPGMEQIWGNKLAPAGVQVIDVHGQGLNTAIVDWQVPGAQGQIAPAFALPAAPVLLYIAIGIIALAWFTSQIRVLVRGYGPPGGGGLSGNIGLIAVAGIAYMALSQRGQGRGPS